MPPEDDPSNNESNSVNEESVEELAMASRETPQQQRRAKCG